MRQLLKSALIGSSLLVAAPALAQDTTEASGGVSTGDGTADANATATTNPDPNAASVTATGNTMFGWWPTSAIDRPFMRGKGKITAGLDYGVGQATTTNPVTMTSVTATVDAINLTGAYGVTDQINAGIGYAGPLGVAGGDFVAGNLDLWGGYQVKHDPKMSLAATADFAINLDDTSNMKIHAGLGFRYTVAPKIAVFTGAPYGPGPVGQHLSISLADKGPITFTVPVGGMYQATPELNVHVMTTLATFKIANSSTGFFGADFVPLALGGLFAVNKNIDVQAEFLMDDLVDAGFDAFAFTIGGRYHVD